MKHALNMTCVLGLIFGFIIQPATSKTDKELFFFLKDFPEVLDLIQRAYVDEVDMQTLMQGAFQGALEQLDPNASYIPAGTSAQNYTQRVFDMTGLVIAKRQNYAFTMAVMPASPADLSGIKAGDYIRQINGLSTRRLNLFQVQALINDAKEPLALLLVRGSESDDLKMTLTPGPWQKPSVLEHKRRSKTLEIKLPFFFPGWTNELSSVLADADPSLSVLLDFRQNALGSGEDLANLASLFLPKGRYLRIVAPDKPDQWLENPSAGAYQQRELSILMDASVSGAAEAFCAISKDIDTWQLLGEKTLGVPPHYHDQPLENGATIRIPSQHYARIEDTKPISHRGVKPDHTFEDIDDWLAHASNIMHKDEKPL